MLPGIRLHTTRQGFFRLDAGWGQEPWAGQVFPTRQLRVFGGAQLFRWLNVFAHARFGRSIYYDPVDPYSGREQHATGRGQPPAERALQPVGLLEPRGVRPRRATATHVYTVDILNTRTTFQIDRELLRCARSCSTTARASEVLTDFLASWELLPGTVAYAGYGSLDRARGWDGSAFTDDPAGVLPHVAARLLLQGVLHPPLLSTRAVSLPGRS